MGAAKLYLPAATIPWLARTVAAGGLFVVAVAFGLLAVRAFVGAATTINPVQIDRASSLVTTGVYAWTRNPMYVALALLLTSWAAWLGQGLLLLGPIAFALFITRFQIVPEEQVLAAKFGEAYDRYRNLVPRWLFV